MTYRNRCVPLAFVLALAAVASPSDALANGDQAHALTYALRGQGVGVTTAAVGLSGRREQGADVPVTTADLTVSGVPTGATIERVYL